MAQNIKIGDSVRLKSNSSPTMTVLAKRKINYLDKNSKYRVLCWWVIDGINHHDWFDEQVLRKV